MAKGGSASIAELQRKSGYGATRFTRRFRDELGMSPKRYARLIRFRRALDALAPGVGLAELALAAGFSDQSHMAPGFRHLLRAVPPARCQPAAIPPA